MSTPRLSLSRPEEIFPQRTAEQINCSKGGIEIKNKYLNKECWNAILKMQISFLSNVRNFYTIISFYLNLLFFNEISKKTKLFPLKPIIIYHKI